jgi:diacylglycerol kinase (ATP)
MQILQLTRSADRDVVAKRLLFWNSNSGKSDAAHLLHDLFTPETTTFVDVSVQSDIRGIIQQQAQEGCDLVVAAGGDGTINAVVNALMEVPSERRPRLGIIPLGTANDLARTLGIPTEIPDAFALIEQDQRLPVDVIRIRNHEVDRFFINVATGGNGSRVSEAMTDEVKARWGAFCYLRGAIAVLTDLVSFRVDVTSDDETIEPLDAWAVLVANGKSNAGHIVIAPDASVTDGLLDLIVVLDGTAIDMVKIATSVIQGNFLESEQVIYRQAKKVSLRSKPGMKFTLDGEVVDDANTSGGETIEFEVVHHALTAIVGDVA